MAIRIQTEKPIIPVELGELKLEFPTDDENIKRLKKTLADYEKEVKAMKPKDDDEEFEMTKQALKRGYDEIFGGGTFDAVYDQTPSLYKCAEYFVQIAEGIKKEIGDAQGDKLKEYLNKKKTKK